MAACAELPPAYVGAQVARVCTGAIVAENCAPFYDEMCSGVCARVCSDSGDVVAEVGTTPSAATAALGGSDVPRHTLPRATFPVAPAYLIFTSGSAGRSRCVAASVVGAVRSLGSGVLLCWLAACSYVYGRYSRALCTPCVGIRRAAIQQ